MWRIMWGDYRDGSRFQQPVYSPRIDAFRPADMDFSMSVAGEAGSLKLTISPDHPAFNVMDVADPSSWAEVYHDSVNGGQTPLWRGYLPESSEPIAGDGYGEVEYTFAGELSQLSQVPCPRFEREFASTSTMSASRALAEFLVSHYNRTVALAEGEDASDAGSRQIALGRVDDFTPTISAADDGTSDVLSVLAGVFVDRLGGYMRIVYADAPTLEILSDLTDGSGNRVISEQPVEWAVNLVDGERTVDALELWTGVKPYGADLKDTSYAGTYYTSFDQQAQMPASWRDLYGDYYRLALFEPLTAEPEGWNLAPSDAHEGGMLSWDQWWWYDTTARRFKRLSALTSTRPTFLAAGSAGIPIFWSCATDVGGKATSEQLNPYSLTAAQAYEHMETVGGFGWTKLQKKPADWDTNHDGYSRPVVQNITVPSVSGTTTGTAAATWTHWMPAADVYERLTSRPSHWGWDSGAGSFSTYYRRIVDAVDVTTGQAVYAYETVSKVFERVTSKPSKWADKYTNYYWRDTKSDTGYSNIGSWQPLADTVGGGAKKWRENWQSCRKHRINQSNGKEDWDEPVEKVDRDNWHKVSGASAWCPATGTMVNINSAAGWNKCRSALYKGTEGKGAKAHGKTSQKNAKWKKGWRVRNGKLYTSSKDKTGEQLWYLRPTKTWAQVKGNCWLREAPRFGLKAVYHEVVPSFTASGSNPYTGPYYAKKAPAWAANVYWAQAADESAPWRGEDNISGEKVWPAQNSWAAYPVYAATGLDDLPLTLDLAPAAKLPAWLASAEKKVAGGDEFSVEGDVLWDETAVELYGRRCRQLDVDDAKTFQTLLDESVRALASESRPVVEVEVSAIDTSPRDGTDPLLPGVYVPYTDPPRGYTRELMPLVEASGLDFGDPSRGRVKLGASASGGINRQKVPSRLGGYAGVVFSTSVDGDLNRGWNDAIGT